MAAEQQKSSLRQRIESGESLLIGEISPPKSGDREPVRAAAAAYAGKVHALGVTDNRRETCMSALAAASLVASEGVEPILHMTTRDRNRIALVSDGLGASALGIRNILCTTGDHQTLGRFRAARNVFDVDSIQLIDMLARLSTDGAQVGEDGFEGLGPMCLGGVASPFADPMELQVTRLAKKAEAGAAFLVTQPVFDLARFDSWWTEVTSRGVHEKTAFVVGIRVLTDAEQAKAFAGERPSPLVPEAVLERLGSKEDPEEQRNVGIEIACETVRRLSGTPGVRGFAIRSEGDDAAALEVIEASGLGIS